MSITLLLETLGSALRLWEHHSKDKYLKQYLELRHVIERERNLPTLDRDNIALSDSLDELRILTEAFNTTIAQTNPIGSPI